jgi:Secretion system C-terminal sorting domain
MQKMNLNYTIALWGLFCLLQLQIGRGQSIRTIDYFNTSSGAYVPSQKLYYGTAGSRPGQKYVNKLLKFNPIWGEVVEEIAVGDDPRFLQPSTDRSVLFFVTDQAARLKRYNISLNRVDQDDPIEILADDRVQALYSLPNNNNQVLLLAQRDYTTSYITVYERGKPKESYFKLSSKEQEDMSIVITNDSLLWVISPSVGTITRLKIRSNGVHFERVFTGYERSLEPGYVSVGNYLISIYGQYLQLSGDMPRVIGRISQSREYFLSLGPDPRFFYALNYDYNRGVNVFKFRRDNFQAVDTLNLPIADTELRRFEACEEDLFVFLNGSMNFAWNCSSKLPKPQIDAPQVLRLCEATDTGYVLKTLLPATQYLWRKNTGPLQQTDRFKVYQSDNYKVKVSDDVGCLTGFSDELYVTFDYPPFKPSITDSTGNASLINLCAKKSVKLLVSGLAPEWSTGETGNSIKVNKSGVFQARIRSAGGCLSQWSDTLRVIQSSDTVPDNPRFALLNSPTRVICIGDTAVFEAPAGYKYYNWTFSEKNERLIKLPLFNFELTMRLRVGNSFYCMSEYSDPLTVRAASVPTKPTIQRSGNVLVSNYSAPTFTHRWFLNGQLVPNQNKQFLIVEKEGFYSVSAGTGNCFSPRSDLLAFTGLLTSTQGLSSNQAPLLYPNPVAEELFLRFAEQLPASNLRIQIFDLKGQLQAQPKFRWEGAGQALGLDVQDLPAGAYVLRVLSASKGWHLKFVKM